MRFIDSHAHLADPAFDEDRDELFARAQKAGIARIVNICTDAETLRKAAAFPSFVALTAATTPHDVEKEGESFFPIVEEAARSGKLVAIGETGLDYYYEHAPRDLQNHFLRRYLRLARELELPIVIHCREAFTDLFTALDESPVPGVLHCFTGTLDEASACVERGLYVSFSGIVTFKKSEELRAAAKVLPLDRILIETDAPYLAPQPMRGKRNESAYVVEVAKCIAETKGLTLEEVAETTAQNASTLFRLDLD